jgi:carboxypeptidase Taq
MEKLRALQKEMKAYTYALQVLSWDSATEAPDHAFDIRAELSGVLSKRVFQLSTSQEYQDVVNDLYDRIDSLSPLEQREVKELKKELDRTIKIPEDLFVEYSVLVDNTQKLWEQAKKEDNYELFKPNLARIIELKKAFIDHFDLDMEPYNVLLDDFEEGFTMEMYDAFFDTLRRDLVPFVKDVLENKKAFNDAFITDHYDRESQKEFSEYLMDVFAFDRTRGLLKESVHPFTWNTHPGDVRLTTRYLEDYMFSSIFATIHELGHATYEQQINPELTFTALSGGTSMGIHESQSRFYENIIGRSKEFWQVHYGKLKSVFPKQLGGVTLEDFVKGINNPSASFIRVEADELTYPLHIMIRYELERDLFSGKLNVDGLPEAWNKKYTDYLGITPKTDEEGVLQDVHWSAGLFGYFPTYALGTAYSCQIYYAMKKELDLEDVIADDNIKKVNEWLKDKIHVFGKTKSPNELILEVTGEPFDAKYYVQFLKEKYTELFL